MDTLPATNNLLPNNEKDKYTVDRLGHLSEVELDGLGAKLHCHNVRNAKPGTDEGLCTETPSIYINHQHFRGFYTKENYRANACLDHINMRKRFRKKNRSIIVGLLDSN